MWSVPGASAPVLLFWIGIVLDDVGRKFDVTIYPASSSIESGGETYLTEGLIFYYLTPVVDGQEDFLPVFVTKPSEARDQRRDFAPSNGGLGALVSSYAYNHGPQIAFTASVATMALIMSRQSLAPVTGF